MPDLAVVIVSWNTQQLTLDTLQTLKTDLETTPDSPQTEIWVVDNASSDGSPEAIATAHPDVNLIASDTNLGFGAGNNAALKAIGFGGDTKTDDLPKAVYLLNSDTRTQPGATQTLYDALMQRPDAGVVGARLSFGDGSFQHSAFKFPSLAQLWIDLLPAPGRLYDHPLNGRYAPALYNAQEPFPVDFTLGATMMLRREVIAQTGMFDAQFHMYCEEIDWSWRIRRAGWQIYCVPQAHVVHLGGQSTGQVRPQSIVNLWHSRLQLFQKYYSPAQRWLARQIIRLGMHYQIRQLSKQDHLSDEEHLALKQAYQTVIGLTKDGLP